MGEEQSSMSTQPEPSTAKGKKSSSVVDPTVVTNGLSAADAVAAVRTAQKTKVEAQETNERGFIRVFDKKSLVGKPFVIVDWEENMGESFWFAEVNIVQGNRALYFTDGSTGVYEQLKKLRDNSGTTTMIECPKGLRFSEYPNPHGEGMSTTFYLNDNV